MSYRMLGDWVRVRKCFKDHLRKEDGSVLLYRTDGDFDTTNFASIVDFGPKCLVICKEDIGRKVKLPEVHNDLKRMVGALSGEDFAVRERLILEFSGATYD